MDSNLLSDFDSQTAKRPNFPLCERGAESWSRDEVRTLARKILRDIRSVPAGTLVGLHCPNGPAFLAALLSLRENGCAVLLLDSGAPPRESQRLVAHFDCGALLRFSDAWRETPWTLDVSPNLRPTVLPTSTVVKLTSGSSGEPRGVVVDESALLADEAALFSTMSLDEERILTTIPLSHSYGFSSIALAALRRDMTIVVPESGSPVSALKALRQSDITFFPSVPAWLSGMNQLRDAAADSLGTLRTLISAGAPLSADLARDFKTKFSVPIQTFYGASECGGIAFDRTGDASLEGALGTPVDGVELRLEGEENLVAVRSAAVASGYHGDREHQSFRNGEFVTSDVGQFDDGVLKIVGRRGDVINLRGKKIHPGEIEHVLRRMPGVTDAFVFCNQSGPAPSLRALVESDHALSRARISEWCRAELADFKVPRALVVVTKIPRTSRGKIDRQEAYKLCGSDS